MRDPKRIDKFCARLAKAWCRMNNPYGNGVEK